MSDFTKEDRALQRLKELMIVQDQGSAQLSDAVEKAVADDFIKKPRRALTRVYEKLGILRDGGLDIDLYEARHKLFDKDLEGKIVKLKEIADKAEVMDADEWIDAHVAAYKDFLQMMMYVAVMEQEVDLQCKNYIRLMGKVIHGNS